MTTFALGALWSLFTAGTAVALWYHEIYSAVVCGMFMVGMLIAGIAEIKNA